MIVYCVVLWLKLTNFSFLHFCRLSLPLLFCNHLLRCLPLTVILFVVINPSSSLFVQIGVGFLATYWRLLLSMIGGSHLFFWCRLLLWAVGISEWFYPCFLINKRYPLASIKNCIASGISSPQSDFFGFPFPLLSFVDVSCSRTFWGSNRRRFVRRRRNLLFV